MAPVPRHAQLTFSRGSASALCTFVIVSPEAGSGVTLHVPADG